MKVAILLVLLGAAFGQEFAPEEDNFVSDEGDDFAPPLPDTTDDAFLQDCVNAHNKYRNMHDTPDLVLDQAVINYAKSRANYVSRFKGLSAGHSGLKGHGENLAWRGDSSVSGCEDAVKRWYDEIKYYNWGRPGFSSKTGHFTQVIWKSSKKLGCARASGRKAGGQFLETYVVCNYLPPGNYQGQFQQNVLPKRN